MSKKQYVNYGIADEFLENLAVKYNLTKQETDKFKEAARELYKLGHSDGLYCAQDNIDGLLNELNS